MTHKQEHILTRECRGCDIDPFIHEWAEFDCGLCRTGQIENLD